ncbi:MAG: hypothetical protein RIT43_1805 [Bacteroidota bacterium]
MRTLFWLVSLILLSAFMYRAVLEKGRASYYSSKFEGRKTASGEIFRQDGLTAAHKTLPFGTQVKVTNLKNDSTIVLKINDRLSKSSGHCIDVTLKAAKKLNFVKDGVANVTIEKLTP